MSIHRYRWTTDTHCWQVLWPIPTVGLLCQGPCSCNVINNYWYLHNFHVSVNRLLHPVSVIACVILCLLLEWRISGLSCSSQLAQFQDFLLRANKYNCLRMVGDGGATDRKLILVEVCTTPIAETVVPVLTPLFIYYITIIFSSPVQWYRRLSWCKLCSCVYLFCMIRLIMIKYIFHLTSVTYINIYLTDWCSTSKTFLINILIFYLITCSSSTNSHITAVIWY